VIVLDTHAWVWWSGADKQLSRRAKSTIDKARKIFVPTVCLREVALLVAHGRLRFDRSVELWLQDACALERVELVALTPRIAAESVSLGAGFHRDPADQVIVATAIALAAPLVTRDERIHAYDRVKAFW
jgi:PIN domain nuclease of toxin-antitoxin system